MCDFLRKRSLRIKKTEPPLAGTLIDLNSVEIEEILSQVYQRTAGLRVDL